MFETRFKYRKYIETGRVFIGVESFALVRVIAASFKKRFDFRFVSIFDSLRLLESRAVSPRLCFFGPR